VYQRLGYCRKAMRRGVAALYLGGEAGADGSVPTPSAGLFLTEPARGVVGLAALPLAAPWLAAAPRGDGRGVLVVPGLLASDMSTALLRRYLRWLGHDVRGWDLGRNVGPTDAVLDRLPQTLAALAETARGPVSVVGWSLGGIYARELARQHPGLVRQVITLGSPFALTDPRQSRADGAYRRRSYLHADDGRVPTREEAARPIGVPSTAVYSRRDGIVSWQACIEPETAQHENVQVRCGHLGFGVDPATLWLIADRLALPADQWRPFRPPASLGRLYPRLGAKDAAANRAGRLLPRLRDRQQHRPRRRGLRSGSW
jgi:pimeloyl-ACP methyl ester carboxylesterase